MCVLLYDLFGQSSKGRRGTGAVDHACEQTVSSQALLPQRLSCNIVNPCVLRYELVGSDSMNYKAETKCQGFMKQKAMMSDMSTLSIVLLLVPRLHRDGPFACLIVFDPRLLVHLLWGCRLLLATYFTRGNSSEAVFVLLAEDEVATETIDV